MPLPLPRTTVSCVTFAYALALTVGLGAQLTSYTPIAGQESDVERLLLSDRGSSGVHAAMRPLTFSDVTQLLSAADSAGAPANWADAAMRARVRTRLGLSEAKDRDVLSGGLGGWARRNFYMTRGYAVDARRGGFRLLLNPVLDLRTGRQTDGGGYNFVNTRGVRIRGQIDDRVYFQSAFYENQVGLRSYEREWRRAYAGQVPGVGFFKAYDPLLYDIPDAVDFIQATGEVGFRLTRHIHARLGHGNPSLGLGQRSALLGDFVDPFFFAEVDTRFWRFHYRNLYAQLQDGTQAAARVERKWLVSHTLSLQLTPAWEFGLTEQTVFKRDGGFDVQYLNPVIFYRAVEQDNGSPDNAMVGFHSNVLLGGTAAVYGQFLFDELKFDELFVNGDKWWANKWAWQLGARYLDAFGATGLTLTAEANTVRPFTFAHRFEGISHTHYNQPLAHPWGADLAEVIVGAEQWVGKRWRLTAKLNRLRQSDASLPPAPHTGANVLYDNDLRDREYGYRIADTAAVNRTLLSARLQFLPFPGAVVEAGYEYYRRGGDGATDLAQHGLHLGLSLNAWQRKGLW